MRWSRLLAPAFLVVVGHTACAKEETNGLYDDNGKNKSSASCVDHCGGASEDESCWCDPNCSNAGDCCEDFAGACGSGVGGGGSWPGSGGTSSGGSGGLNKPGFGGAPSGGGAPSTGGSGGGTPPPPPPPGNSCKNHCGGQSADGSCFCNPDCQQYGDCCPDFILACGAPPPPGGCTAALCLSDSPAPDGCYCDPYCIEFGDCCPNWADVCF
jgi:hypothetical protein